LESTQESLLDLATRYADGLRIGKTSWEAFEKEVETFREQLIQDYEAQHEEVLEETNSQTGCEQRRLTKIRTRLRQEEQAR
jgi:hypothetical protein